MHAVSEQQAVTSANSRGGVLTGEEPELCVYIYMHVFPVFKMSSCYTVPPRASRAQRSPNSTENRDTDEQHLSGVQVDTKQHPAVQQLTIDG